jgi:hypothetical protein
MRSVDGREEGIRRQHEAVDGKGAGEISGAEEEERDRHWSRERESNLSAMPPADDIMTSRKRLRKKKTEKSATEDLRVAIIITR